MSYSISSKSVTLDDFQKFSEQASMSETAVVGKKLIGSGLKAVSSLSFQRTFRGTSEIVADFKKGLTQKYGQEIADFVFSQENEQIALSQGLNKKTIAAVLQKAELANNSEFFSYRAAISSKKRFLERQIEQPPKSSQTNARKAYLRTQYALENCANLFNRSCSGTSGLDAEDLKKYFQQNLEVVNQLSRNIILDRAEKVFEQDLHMNPEEARKSISLLQASLGDRLSTELLSELAVQRESIQEFNDIASAMVVALNVSANPRNSTATTVSEEEEEDRLSFFRDVDDSPELQALYEKHPQLKQFLENLSLIPEILQTKTDQLNEQLKSFMSVPTTIDPKSFFYISDDASSTSAICSPQDSSFVSPTVEQQEAAAKAAKRFFGALKEFYGEELIDTLVPAEQQSQPLTVEYADEVKNKLQETVQKISEFLKGNPIIITPEYLVALAHDQDAASVVQASHAQLGAEGNTLVKTLREMGICGMILAGSKIALAVAGVSISTPACIILALTAAAVDGYIVGRLVSQADGLPADIQHQSGTASAVSTTGSAAGLMVNHALQPLISAYIPEIVSSTVVEYAGSYGALALREAARGGVRTAQQGSHEEAIDHNQASNQASNQEDHVFLQPRIVRFFNLDLQYYVDSLCISIGTLGGLMSGSPPIASSSSNTTAPP